MTESTIDILDEIRFPDTYTILFDANSKINDINS